MSPGNYLEILRQSHVVSWSCNLAEAWFCPDPTPSVTLSSQRCKLHSHPCVSFLILSQLRQMLQLGMGLECTPVFIPFHHPHCTKEQEKHLQMSLLIPCLAQGRLLTCLPRPGIYCLSLMELWELILHTCGCHSHGCNRSVTFSPLCVLVP